MGLLKRRIRGKEVTPSDAPPGVHDYSNPPALSFVSLLSDSDLLGRGGCCAPGAKNDGSI